MAKVNLKHSGAVIDQQIDRVIDGSVVLDNTDNELKADSPNPVSGEGIAKAIEAASNSLKQRGYIYMGVATPTTTPDVSGGKVFYLAAQAGEYTYFGYTLPTDALTSLEWNGERWFAVRIADLVTPAEVEQAILDNTASKVTEDGTKPVSGGAVAKALAPISELAEKNKEDIAKKANTTEHYPSMAVGVADNLRGRGEAKEEFFTYRPSAGATNSISEEGVATMQRIKGNSLVWNQLIERMNNPERGGLSFAYENKILTVTGVAQEQWYPSLFSTPIENSDHRFLLSVKKIDGQYTKASQGTRSLWIYNGVDGWGGAADGDNNYKIFAGVSSKDLGLACNVGDVFDNCRFAIEYHDLTQMFGAGNEPTILEDFYANIPAGIDVNAYNEGELISLIAESIKTTGFNQWDEKWERGVYQIGEGGSGIKLNGGSYDSYIRSADYIDVLPNTTYCVLKPNQQYVVLGGFDKNNVFIGQIGYDKDTSSYALFTTPRNCAKIVFHVESAEYNNDICINLSHSGVRNGEYEPYEERVHEIPEIAQYFPEGMRSAGSIYDEITESEVIKRVGVVHLGSLDWKYGNPFGGAKKLFYSNSLTLDITTAVTTNTIPNLTSRYDTRSANLLTNTNKDKAITAYAISGKRIIIADSAYTDATTFKAAMQGVMLSYELASPIVTPIPTRAINLNYPVWDWGTERAVSDVPSAPFRADIIYGFNAVDTIRTNKLDIEALMLRVAELEAKIAETSTTTMEEEIL